MAVQYLEYGASSTPITGRYLAHNQLSLVEKAYLGADLHTGKRVLVAPTVVESAMLARVNTTYVHYALKQEANRFAIEHRYTPLVPPRIKELTVPMVPEVYDQAAIIDIVRRVGIGRVLDAACAVEAAQ
jgi:hypothetical protein